MADHKELDQMLKDTLSDKADDLTTTAGRFSEIKATIEGSQGRKNYIFRYLLPNIRHRQVAAALLCGLLVVFAAPLALSGNVRAMAIETLHKVQTIFIIDKVGDEYKVVEKPATERNLEPSVNVTTKLSDSEIEKKIGYKAIFPFSVDGGYQLDSKLLMVYLGKKTDYNTAQKNWDNLRKAIDDDNELEKLKKYGAKRGVYGVYKKGEKKIIIDVNNNQIFESSFLNAGSRTETVKVDDIEGKWIELPFPMYPGQNGGNADITQKPTSIKKYHALIWNKQNIYYMLFGYQDENMTLDEAAGIATSFMESQK